MRWKPIALFLVVCCFAGAAARYEFVNIRDDLAGQRAAIAENWTRVEAALDRRAAAIPVLMDAIPGKSRDSTVRAGITAARTRLAEAKGAPEKLRAHRELSTAIARLLLDCESDPKTRSGAGFRQMQDELRAREDEIAAERFQYNNALEHYNARMQQFPVNIVASLAGFTRNDAYFSTGPDAAAISPP